MDNNKTKILVLVEGAKTETFLKNEFMPVVIADLQNKLGCNVNCYIENDEPQTVVFAYDRSFDDTSILPVIRLEIGALAAWTPAAEKYAKEQEKSEYAKNNKRIVKERFRNLSGQKVLDLGCGYGYYTDYFSSIGADVSGVDGSEIVIEIARFYSPDCSFVVCDITEKIPFSDNSFDLIFCNQVFMFGRKSVKPAAKNFTPYLLFQQVLLFNNYTFFSFFLDELTVFIVKHKILFRANINISILCNKMIRFIE